MAPSCRRPPATGSWSPKRSDRRRPRPSSRPCAGSRAAVGHGLAHLAGARGIAAAVMTLVLLGLSSSGGAVGYQFEPGFYGAVSQLLPPGAAVTAVRNVRYFDWADTLEPLVVLGAWALGGVLVGLLRERFGAAGRGTPPARRRDGTARAAAPA